MDGIDLTFARMAEKKNAQRREDERKRLETVEKRLSVVLILRVLFCIPMVIFVGNKAWQYMKTPFETLEAIGVICCLLVITWTVDDCIKYRESRPDHKGKSTN